MQHSGGRSWRPVGLISASPKGENVESSSEAAVERRNEAVAPFC